MKELWQLRKLELHEFLKSFGHKSEESVLPELGIFISAEDKSTKVWVLKSDKGLFFNRMSEQNDWWWIPSSFRLKTSLTHPSNPLPFFSSRKRDPIHDTRFIFDIEYFPIGLKNITFLLRAAEITIHNTKLFKTNKQSDKHKVGC